MGYCEGRRGEKRGRDESEGPRESATHSLGEQGCETGG